MKTFVAFVSIFLTATNIFSQDSLLIKRIDSLVIQIDKAKLTTINDSVNNSDPKFSMEMYTYSTAFFRGIEFSKFSSKDSVKTNFNGVSSTMKTMHVLYFYKRKLIKAEAYISQSNFSQHMIWYYWNRRLIKKSHALPVHDKNDEANLELGDVLLNRYQKRS